MGGRHHVSSLRSFQQRDRYSNVLLRPLTAIFSHVHRQGCPSLQIMQIMHFELSGVLTWALNIYHKGPQLLVTNKPKRVLRMNWKYSPNKFKCRGAFACSRDKNRNHHQVNFRQVSDTYPTCATILLVVCFLFGRTLTQQRTNEQGCRRYFPSSLRHTGVSLRRSLPWDERFVRKRMGCTEYRLERPGILTNYYTASFRQWQRFWISSIFQSKQGWQNPNLPPRYRLLSLLTLFTLLS